MDAPAHAALRARLATLRTELADLAFALERQGRCDAADIANHLGRRLASLEGEAGAEAAELADSLALSDFA